MLVFEHCEACPAPCGGGTVTRSMGRVANATLLRFGRYDESPDSRTETPVIRSRIFDHGRVWVVASGTPPGPWDGWVPGSGTPSAPSLAKMGGAPLFQIF